MMKRAACYRPRMAAVDRRKVQPALFNWSMSTVDGIFHDQLYTKKYFKISLEIIIKNLFVKILTFWGTFGIRACLKGFGCLIVPNWDSVGFAIGQIGLSQIQQTILDSHQQRRRSVSISTAWAWTDLSWTSHWWGCSVVCGRGGWVVE